MELHGVATIDVGVPVEKFLSKNERVLICYVLLMQAQSGIQPVI
jgi:hypothetical protein